MKKSALAILLTALLLVSFMPVTAFAVDYTDTQGHWGEGAINRWSSHNIVSGKGNGIFDPDGFMNRAEVAKVFTNLVKLKTKADMTGYTDAGLDKWYNDAMAKCMGAGIMGSYTSNIMNPNGTITRESFFVMFCRTLGIKPVDSAKVSISDAADISNYAKGYINALVNKGYLNGIDATENGITIAPKLNIDRASVMSLIDKTVTTYVDTTESVTIGDGLTLVVVDNTKLSFKKDSENAHVFVCGNNATITNAPVDAVITISDEVTGTRVNGKSISNDTTNKKVSVKKGGEYFLHEEVAKYIHLYKELPPNYMTNKQARSNGWKSGNPQIVLGGNVCIGGGKFGNKEKLLPEGIEYFECDVDYYDDNRGSCRLIYTADGEVYYTNDHYASFKKLY